MTQREKKLCVSRARLQKKAHEIYQALVEEGTSSSGDFSASEGWLINFMQRHNISLRRTTTACQKAPEDYIAKLINFIMYVQDIVSEKKIGNGGVYACDETAVWLDAMSNTTLEESGTKEVSVKTTGHDKMRITVLLCAKVDGTKLKPFILIPRNALFQRSSPSMAAEHASCSRGRAG